MTKKDILIFLHLYLLAVKGVVSKSEIEDFRSEIYRLLIICNDYSDFRQYLSELKLYVCHYSIFRGFSDYMSRIANVLDKN